MAQHIGDKGRREYVYTPERPSAVFLLGCTHHRNGDGGCEPAQLNVVARVRPEGPLSTTYIGPCRRRSRNGSRNPPRMLPAAGTPLGSAAPAPPPPPPAFFPALPPPPPP